MPRGAAMNIQRNVLDHRGESGRDRCRVFRFRRRPISGGGGGGGGGGGSHGGGGGGSHGWAVGGGVLMGAVVFFTAAVVFTVGRLSRGAADLARWLPRGLAWRWRLSHGWYGGGYYGAWGGLGYGLFFATLPWYYDTYWWDGAPYYYADDVY